MSHEPAAFHEHVLENAYYKMLDAAPDALVMADADGIIRLVNAQTEELFGYLRTELLAAPIELLLPERMRASHVSHRQRFATAPRPRAMGSGLELLGRRKDGSEFALEVSLSPLKTDAGLFVLSALRDVTERKRAELGNLLLASIVDSSDDAIFSSNVDGAITSWNCGATQMFGYTAEEAIGRPISIVAPSSQLHEQSPPYGRLLLGEKIAPYETIYKRKDGTAIHLSVRISAIRDAHGKLLGASCTARDISEQRMAAQREQLVGQRLLSAVESIQGMFALFDKDDRLVVCNSDFREFFSPALTGAIAGRSFSDLVDGSIRSELFALGDATPEQFRASWFAHHRNPGHTFELRTRGGRTLRFMDRLTSEGGTVKTVWDVSDDVHAADEQRSARLLAESVSAAKSEFLASMSHELRTPLNAILGFAQLLQRDKKTPLSERQRDQVDHIVRGGEHLLHLIDDVLDLARIEAGRVAISIEPVSVPEVLHEVQTTLSPMAARAQVALDVAEWPDAQMQVLADRVRFAQVLMNFGSNAIKYGKAHGHVRFVVSAPREDLLRVSVVDDGHGIAPDKQAKLFEPFQRAGQEFGPIEGTGIGLMICKRLASIMGGEVGFTSELGVGSAFWIELPAHHQEEERVCKPSVEARRDSQPPRTRRTVVYIEDNPSNIAFMRDVMEELGNVQLLTAHTAEIGIEIVRSLVPDLVLMDINLPGMSGIDATQKLREWPETKAIPVVALTAAAMLRERQRKDISVFDRYLTKPLNVDELNAVLEQYFDKQPKLLDR